MEKRYSCPECGVVLNPGQKIILLGHRNGVDLLFAFHPEPGNYEMDLPPGAVVREGEVWEFVCPVCHESLSLTGEQNLAALDMTDGAGNPHKVIFSRVAGKHQTFVLTQGQRIEVEEFGVNFAKEEDVVWENFI